MADMGVIEMPYQVYLFIYMEVCVCVYVCVCVFVYNIAAMNKAMYHVPM